MGSVVECLNKNGKTTHFERVPRKKFSIPEAWSTSILNKKSRFQPWMVGLIVFAAGTVAVVGSGGWKWLW